MNSQIMQIPTSYQAGSANPILLVKGVMVVMLVAWMAMSLSGLFWRLLPQPDLKAVDIASNAAAFAPTKATAAPSVDIASLKNIPLFGKEIEEAPVEAAQVVKEEKVEATKLNLELVGSFASEVREI